MAVTQGTNYNLTPQPLKNALASNYIDFTSAGTKGWAQQHLPDLMEAEAEVFGTRTIAGFLSQVGAEEAMTSDQVIWSEQGRLHLAYKAQIAGASSGVTDADQLTLSHDIDDKAITAHAVRVGDVCVVSDVNQTTKCYVTAVAATTIDVWPYDNTTLAAAGIAGSSAKDLRVFVYGSEFIKGQDGRAESVSPEMVSHTNKPVIIKDMYNISGSDASQIGWVEVSGEEGQNGYLWYLKAEGDTRARFTDYLEMMMVEHEKNTGATGLTPDVPDGSEGLFAAIEDRGNMSTGLTSATPATNLTEFASILAEFDKNGAIEENMMFLNRTTSLNIDDMLANQNAYGSGGTSYGVFNNSEDMALNLGFSGFRRGSYDFYKSDWKYLNDLATRGSINDVVNDIRGVFIPAGVSSVYDQQLGKNLKRPFLHVRYRSSQTDNRKLKTWITGSVGATTSSLDAMEVHYLSERCLVVQGANNFLMLTGTPIS